MIDIRDALYIPGLGFSVSKTKDQSLGSAEADFAALLEEVRAAREKRQTEAGPQKDVTRRPLSELDIKELAARYDPTNMTQKEYDSLLEDLIGKGALTKGDMSYLDYRGDLVPNGELVCVGHWDILKDGPLRGSMGSALVWTGSTPPAPAISYRPTGANVLAWAKEMSLWKPVGASNSLLDANNRRHDIFCVLADTLSAMQH